MLNKDMKHYDSVYLHFPVFDQIMKIKPFPKAGKTFSTISTTTDTQNENDFLKHWAGTLYLSLALVWCLRNVCIFTIHFSQLLIDYANHFTLTTDYSCSLLNVELLWLWRFSYEKILLIADWICFVFSFTRRCCRIFSCCTLN